MCDGLCQEGQVRTLPGQDRPRHGAMPRGRAFPDSREGTGVASRANVTGSEQSSWTIFRKSGGGNELNVRNATLTEVATVLQGSVLDKPVADQTGLTEKIRFHTEVHARCRSEDRFWSSAPPATDSLDVPPDVFAAFQQQLGLRFISTNAPADVLVIDRAAKPFGELTTGAVVADQARRTALPETCHGGYKTAIYGEGLIKGTPPRSPVAYGAAARVGRIID